VANGVITVEIVEGRLTEIAVSGNDWLRTRYIESRLERGTDPGDPVNVYHLQGLLKLLKQDPLIDNINAELRPGLKLGEAALHVAVDEARPYYLEVGFNNHQSPSIGAYRGEIRAGLLNITGWGDSLDAEYGITEGLDDFSLRYAVPVTRWDTTLSGGFERSESTVVADPFGPLDIKSETDTWHVALRHPFYRTVSNEFALSLEFENRRGETSLLGEGFSFSEGVPPDGQSEIAVLRFAQEWIDRTLTQVIAARSTFSFGLDAMGATVHDDGRPDGEFFTWLGQFQWLRRLEFLDSQTLFRVDLRLSDDPLLPMEKFAIGGADTVRGYRENQMTTDGGIVASLEWRIPVFQLRVPLISARPTDGWIRACPFIDAGAGWNAEGDDPDPDTLASIGLGLRWDLREAVYARIYWGHALEDVPDPSDWDLQDDGFHFEIGARLF
jgi:hemolysin activation/secretion protein